MLNMVFNRACQCDGFCIAPYGHKIISIKGMVDYLYRLLNNGAFI